MSLGNVIVRANYLATVLFGSGLALFVATFMLSDAIGPPAKDWAVIAKILVPTLFLFVLPGARALKRLIVIGTVIPPQLVHERPVVAWVVTLAGCTGHFFFVIAMSAAIDIAFLPEWPDDVGGPLAFVASVALLSYLIALLCGELALVGDGVSEAARATRSGPIC